MNIGITSIGYQCREHLDKVFAPWVKIKQGALKDKIDNLWIGTAHACFVETFVAGYPKDSTDGTVDAFNEYKNQGVIDQLTLFENPDYEFNVWNSNLPFLFGKNIDLLWMINLDEVWELEEISTLIDITKKHPQADYFKINFKNFVFNYNTYVDDFVVPRVWRTNRNGGIKGFHYDDEMTFNNGETDKKVPFLVIPKNVLFPKHYSWVGSKEYLQRKLRFQTEHYLISSYKWDDEKDCLAFNEEYYEKFNKEKPTLYKI